MSATRARMWIGWAFEALVWSALLVGVWVTTLSGVTTSDMIVGASSAVACAVLAVAARRAIAGAWRPPPHAVRWLVWIPVAAVADAGRMFGLAARRLRTRLSGPRTGTTRPRLQEVRVRLRPSATDSEWAGAAAAAIAAISATPGSYVVQLNDPGEPPRLLVHAPVDGWPHMTRQVGP